MLGLVSDTVKVKSVWPELPSGLDTSSIDIDGVGVAETSFDCAPSPTLLTAATR